MFLWLRLVVRVTTARTVNPIFFSFLLYLDLPQCSALPILFLLEIAFFQIVLFCVTIQGSLSLSFLLIFVNSQRLSSPNNLQKPCVLFRQLFFLKLLAVPVNQHIIPRLLKKHSFVLFTRVICTFNLRVLLKFQKNPLILLEDGPKEVAHHSKLLYDITSVKFFIESAKPTPEVQIIAVFFFIS